jgi:pimeloyl-ACP methyl ester carboxylesterase
MPALNYDDITIDYDVYGRGHPLLLFAPGGLHSVAQMWRGNPSSPGNPMPWIDPTTALADHFRVVAMDQRNAGNSTAPITAGDGWPSYASDQVALADHLGLQTTHIMGGCIGSSYCLGFIQAAPGRVTAAVLQNPIGLTEENQTAFLGMFDHWAGQVKQTRPQLTDGDLNQFKENMFGGDFVFSVDRDFVRQCPVPLLVLAGDDDFHPRAVAEEIADLAPDAELVIEWAGVERYPETRQRVLDFLTAHTPR